MWLLGLCLPKTLVFYRLLFTRDARGEQEEQGPRSSPCQGTESCPGHCVREKVCLKRCMRIAKLAR